MFSKVFIQSHAIARWGCTCSGYSWFSHLYLNAHVQTKEQQDTLQYTALQAIKSRTKLGPNVAGLLIKRYKIKSVLHEAFGK